MIIVIGPTYGQPSFHFSIAVCILCYFALQLCKAVYLFQYSTLHPDLQRVASVCHYFRVCFLTNLFSITKQLSVLFLRLLVWLSNTTLVTRQVNAYISIVILIWLSVLVCLRSNSRLAFYLRLLDSECQTRVLIFASLPCDSFLIQVVDFHVLTRSPQFFSGWCSQNQCWKSSNGTGGLDP